MGIGPCRPGPHLPTLEWTILIIQGAPIATNTTAHAPVVVGVDDGPDARAVARYAAWEAERRGVGLRLVFCHQPTPMWEPSTLISDDNAWEDDWARGVLQSAQEDVANAYPQLLIDVVVMHGRPAGALVSESARASLLVVGTRSLPGIRGRLAGSVAAQVAAHAATPVVILRSAEPQYVDPSEFIGRPVVVGVDGSDESARAFEFAAEQAVARQTQLRAVQVWDFPHIRTAAPLGPDDYDMRVAKNTAERLLAEATAGSPASYPDLVVVRQTVHDVDPAKVLCDSAATAGLLVVGSRGHGGFLGLRLGSTVDALIRQAPAPLAVVRGTNNRQ